MPRHNPDDFLIDRIVNPLVDGVREALENLLEPLLDGAAAPRGTAARIRRARQKVAGGKKTRPAPRQTQDRTLYDVLGVSRYAEPEAIAGAYKALARKWHPDQNPGSQRADQRMREINRAYEVLSDPKKRREYDRNLPH